MTRFRPALLPTAVVLVHVVVINCLPVGDEFGIRYRTNEELENFLIRMANQHPDKVYTFSIGKSVEGNNIMAVAVAASDPHMHVTLRPNVLFTANIHGNEVVGREILLHLLSHLLTAYGENKLITELMDSTRLVMIPSMNPDGFNAAAEGDCFSVRGRSNKHGVDLNRNYPNIWRPIRVQHEPETIAFINWVKTVPTVLSMDFHDDSRDFYSAAPDDDVFRNIALQYSKCSETMASMVNTWCPPDPEIFKDGITNGADWYGIEGIKGVVRKKETNDPVVAKMKIVGREIAFFSDSNGEFYRILLPGKYRLIAEVAEYAPALVDFEITPEAPYLTLNITVSKEKTSSSATFYT
ncbi:hypothetical protein M514_11724 [Trichuris suis]|uniref:Peptidase M14 domain-containing protein n=1 Tax=Trichuris suis TaxID=68888 RepID=A0A085N0P1_9BILA|nr:hypothetical protein M513_11724 [Trichuris suis]KFD63037.1 hypothetical protein M514_11724 [Trichuris suis]